MPDEAVVDRIRETKPLALLVTSMFSTEQQMVDDLVSEVKKAYPHLPIIAGGIHATVQQDWTLESGNIDFVVLGEGEETAVELLRKIQSEGAVAVKQKGQIIKQRSPIQDLDRHWAIEEVLLRDGEYRYNDRASRRGQTYTHLTQPDWTRTFSLYYSRGCPVHCDYCASSEKDGTKIRHMGSERMFSEFRLLHERYGIQIFYNQADTFGFHREDIELLRMIKEYRKEDPEFVVNNPNAFFVRIFFPRSKNYELDEELLDLFAGGGFNVMTIAIETFNQRFNKKIDFEKIPKRR
ncbi:MAG TPA: cobalamin-dependent protein [Candidatus Nanoarchaeia archaeon]|nr:cobalamin-dependent protein [Candidatus Nanoarchaeia archaeon]